MAEGGDAGTHGEGYAEAVRNSGDLVYKEVDRRIKVVYEQHDLVILSGLERRVDGRNRYENVGLIKESDIASDTRKQRSLKMGIRDEKRDPKE